MEYTLFIGLGRVSGLADDESLYTRLSRPKIYRFKLVSTVGGPFRIISKIDCRLSRVI